MRVTDLDSNEVEGVRVEAGQLLQIGSLHGVVVSDSADFLPNGGVGVSERTIFLLLNSAKI